MKSIIRIYSKILLVLLLLNVACQTHKPARKLPVLNKVKIVNGDTVYQKIPSFTFLTQDSISFHSDQLKGKIHVADFFFTSCPGICPVLTNQMRRLQQITQGTPDLMFVSFTVDPARDTPSKLKTYARQYRADLSNWVFLTGPEDSIYHVGRQGYYLGMAKDSTEPGGYMHSGKFVLVDWNGLIRGYYDGTDANDVDRLARDIRILTLERNEQK